MNNRSLRVFAALMLLIGVALLIGGVQLIWLGGSIYYAVAGTTAIASAVLLWRADRRGAWLYGALVLGTLIWSVVEVGFDGWALMPRLLMWLVLGSWLLIPHTRRALHGASVKPLWTLRSTRVGALIIAALIIAVLIEAQPKVAKPIERAKITSTHQDTEWRHYGRTSFGTRYAPIAEITPNNVRQLKRAWTFRTGIDGAFKATPLQVGEFLYVCTAGNVIIALDADTGVERWRFDPKVNTKTIGFTTTCRGVTFYRSPRPLEHCQERILTATTDARMFAVDARHGTPCADFGQGGEISLLTGMGEVAPGYYYVTSPPTIARDVAVLGGWVVDNQSVNEPSGVVRAFDPITGKLKWAWDMGRPGVHTEPAPGEQYTRGTPNAWSVFSADDELGLVYIPTGNSTPDYFGAHRSEVAEKYASSIVALDVTTGEVRWSFQTTHHDLWDYDVPAQPVLTTMPNRDGVDTPAVIVPTKRGELFVFDRRDGTPLAAIEEKPVPQNPVTHEWVAKTQPYSVGMPSFAGADLTERDMWGITPIDQLLCRIEFHQLRYDGQFTPPMTTGSIQYPGFAGGMNWGSVSVHEPARLMVVQSLHMANKVKLTPREQVTPDTPTAMGGKQLGTPYLANTYPWLSVLYAPCQRPPYGEMAVVDLRTRQVIWQRPLGNANELGPLGLKLKVPIPIGAFFSGGTLVTQSGLIFVGGVMDHYFRAIDLYTGKELWRDYLPGQAQATPMSYLGPKSQRQFVVITVPGKNDLDLEHGATVEQNVAQERGGYLIAYAL